MTRLAINYSDAHSQRERIEIEVPDFEEDASWTGGNNVRLIRQAITAYRASHGQQAQSDYNFSWSRHHIEILPDIFDPAHGLADEHVDVITISYRHDGSDKQMDIRVPSPFGNPDADGLGWGFKRNNIAKDAIKAQSGLPKNADVGINHCVRVVSTGTPAPVELMPMEAPEGYITKEALAQVMRDLAIDNNWCSAHHQPLRTLGVEPKTVTFRTFVTVQIPVEYTKVDYFGTEPSTPDVGYPRPSEAQTQAILEAVKDSLRGAGIYPDRSREAWTYGDAKDIRMSTSSELQKVLK